MSLASKLLAVLADFRHSVAQQVNSGQLLTLDNHIDRMASVIDSDVNAADSKAKEVLAELYTALHGAPATPDTPPVDDTPAPVATAPAPPVDVTPAPVAAPVPVTDPAPVDQEPAPVQAAPEAPVDATAPVAAPETPAS